MSDVTGKAAMFAALAKLQAEMPKVVKDKKAKVPMKSGGTYSYSYADLATVSEQILPRLAALGLAFIARPTVNEGGKFVLAYSLVHESGEREDGAYPLTQGSHQETGSAITYARRYALCAVTGIAADEDDDASVADNGNQSVSGAFESASPQRPQQQRGGNGNGQQRQWKPRENAANGAKSQQERRQEPKRPAGQDLGDWGVKVAEIATPDDVIAIREEVTRLYDKGAIEADRANEIRRAIDARVAELRGRARQAQQQPADGAEPAQDAGDSESAWAVEFTDRVDDADNYEDIRGLKLELARAVKDKTVTPEIANELGDVLKNRQNELRSAA